jgi:hypothetical protein
LSKARFCYWRSKLEGLGNKRSSSFLSVVASPGSFPLAVVLPIIPTSERLV